ncbi:MAG: hypothetical protein IJ679_04430 [Lachnospiraceae bacterium]|nr:hypothetical protein [Lachnospiraceae bacterium]
MKAKNRKKMLAILCLATIATSAFPVRAAENEYALNWNKPHPGVSLAAPEEGFAFSNDSYVYGDTMYYSVYKTEGDFEGSTVQPTVTLDIYQANLDGSNPQKLSTQTVYGLDGRIELVTENYILISYGYAYFEDGLLLDKRTGQAKKVESIFPIGYSQKDYNKKNIVTKHIDEYYLMSVAHSDVSPQKILVFNGKNANKATVAKKGWDARFVDKKIYYIFDKKGSFYLGSCTYKGKKNKTITKLKAPENCAYLGFDSINRKGFTYRAMTESGLKKYTYSFEK